MGLCPTLKIYLSIFIYRIKFLLTYYDWLFYANLYLIMDCNFVHRSNSFSFYLSTIITCSTCSEACSIAEKYQCLIPLTYEGEIAEPVKKVILHSSE